MQGNQKELEQKALRIKQDRDEHIKRLEQEKNREEFAERQKNRQKDEKSRQFKYKVKSIIAVILFAAIVGLLLGLSLIQRDYTGVEISFRKHAEGVMEKVHTSIIETEV